MTAPVSQQRAQVKWAVSFMMPAANTMETLPTDDEPNITLRQAPVRRVAAVRYTGFWREEKYLLHNEKQGKQIKDNRFNVTGDRSGHATINPLQRKRLLITHRRLSFCEPDGLWLSLSCPPFPDCFLHKFIAILR
ncbi:hypothetical protein FCL47_12330 [Desulfopila sp. IMCC35006]|uniref:heme-binding protein n=1 Tax=Desulfopila sp. IMCC35006 TaxID=2569542 RepID=UPI0010AC5C0C|nr:heme-binding protein [Desulfopila sp. IMCC35006]TKB25876.1 hypothetical protein FCL47_12330 [Desulfopila sp. IMCC35006]